MTMAHLKYLSPSEIEEYFNHHVHVAGAKKQLIEPPAIIATH